MMTLNVADISRYQDTSVIPVLRGGGTDAIIVGVTFGCAGNNPIYTQQLAATALNGMLRGAYHIRARVNWTPQEEADFFLAHMTGYLDGRTVLVLDWEECDTSDEAWALAWLQYVEAKTGIKPWFYVNLSDLLKYRFPSIAANGNAIWLAQYPYSSVNGYAGVNWQPQAIPPGHTLAAWQYVGTGGNVNGVGQLDLSVAYINADGWLAYASSTSAQSGTITPIEGFLMALSDDEQRRILAAADRINGVITDPKAKVLTTNDLPAVADGVLNRSRARSGGPAGDTTLGAVVSWFDANVQGLAGAIPAATVNQLQPALIAVAQGIGDLKSQPSAAAPVIDVPALAAQIAAALNTNQAHDFLVAFRNALPAN